MNVQTFFEQLAFQLSVAQIKYIESRWKRKRLYVRCLVKYPDLPPELEIVWDIYRQARFATHHHFRLHHNWLIKNKHIAFLRQAAAELRFPKQRAALLSGNRKQYQAVEDGWEKWDEVFEDFVKELGFEPAAKEPSPTE